MAKNSFLDSQPVKLFISVGGIWTSYIFYGVIMERLYKIDYSGLDRPKGSYEPFKFGFATSLFQHLFSFILAAFVQRTYFNQSKSKIDVKSQIKISAESFFSIFLSSQALAFVSFPIQAIMKSSKIISIIIVSLALRIKGQHTTSQYICGVIVTAGILLFNFGDGGQGKHGDEKATSIIGLGLLFISLFCDGLLGVSQQEVNKAYKPSSWDMMEVMNKWGGILCVAIAVVTGQLFGFIEFVKAYPAVWTDLIMISALGTIGQIFIFYTITNFSPFVLSIVTSTRKCFTLLLSILYFGHPVSPIQWIAIGLVFLGVVIEMFAKKSKKPEEKPENNSVKSNMEMPQIRKPTKGE